MREPVPTYHHSRRNFLSSVGTGFAGVVFGAGALRADSAVKTSSSNEFNVRAFGAVGDGTILDSPAIDKAIAAAAASEGGTVRFPAGTYFELHNSFEKQCNALPRSGRGDSGG